MEYPDFAATEAPRKVYENKIAYNNHRVGNEEDEAPNVSMDQAQPQ